MLEIKVTITELFDEENSIIIPDKQVTLELEHSLLSLSKWEEEFEKPFLSDLEKTAEEFLFYIKLMILTPDYDPEILDRLSKQNVQDIIDYMKAKKTATWINDRSPQKPNREIVTSELIYFWMTNFQIPFSCETWHLNRLMTLVQVASIKNSPPKKMSRDEIARENAEINRQRRAAAASRG
jgi:hypothetical protein